MADILLLENEVDTRENIAGFLELYGYNVVCANNGRQAFILTKTIWPDLIISNIDIPEKDCYKFLEELKSNKVYQTIPIIYLCSKTLPENILTRQESGTDNYLSKPYNKLELLKSIQNKVA